MPHLLSFDPPLHSTQRDHSPDTEPDARLKGWWHYVPLGLVVAMMIAPHFSLFLVLVDHYLLATQKPASFLVHSFVIYSLTFLSFSSLIVCVVRDPGPVNLHESPVESSDDYALREALMSGPDDDEMSPQKWCRKCWAPKYERTHHCTQCNRCVLKMDHHCPWLGNVCVGHQTYPSFFHFIACITLFSAYVAGVGGNAFLWSFDNPGLVSNPATPIHELGLLATGTIFGLIMGSFTIYHIYLISTNQTTLESLSPFLLLKYLPPLPSTRHVAHPPMEHELSYRQRVLVRDAHSAVKLYDLGWRRNWAQVFGWGRPKGWVPRILYGGPSPGDGRSYSRNPRAEEMLRKLAVALAMADKDG